MMIVNLLNQVDAISQGFVMQGYQNLVSAYSTAIYGLIALVVIFFGYAIVNGWVELSQGEIIKRALMAGLVIALAMNWGNFSQTIYALFTQGPNQISGHLLSAIPNGQFSNASSGNVALEEAWDQGIGAASAVWTLGSFDNALAWLWGAILMLLVIIFIGLALIDLIIAKFGLAIFLVLSPIAIPMVLFKPTKEALFDGWFRHLITFALVPIFVYSALALSLALLNDASASIQAAINDNTITLTAVAPYGIYFLVCIGLIVKAASMASSLGAGFSMGAAQHMASRAGNQILKKLQEMRDGKGEGKKGAPGSQGKDKPTNETQAP